MPLLFVVIWIVFLPSGTAAHGTDYRVLDDTPVVAAEFLHSDKDPMRYAEVLVFSPENKNVEYQNGRTDRNGRFAFCPEMPGKWLIKVNDGMGHAVRAEVSVDFPETESEAIKGLADKDTPAARGTSKWIKVILGLSIVLNLFLGMYVMKKGKS
jgi:nickel transport protein